MPCLISPYPCLDLILICFEYISLPYRALTLPCRIISYLTFLNFCLSAPPVLGTVSPGFLIHREGSNAELFCEATGTPWPTVTWLKDGKELMSRSHVSVNDNKVLIKHLVKSDGGVYICLFKNTVAQVSHIIQLVIEGSAYCWPMFTHFLYLFSRSSDTRLL